MILYIINITVPYPTVPCTGAGEETMIASSVLFESALQRSTKCTELEYRTTTTKSLNDIHRHSGKCATYPLYCAPQQQINAGASDCVEGGQSVC